MNRRAWWATVYGVANSGTRLRDFTFTFNFHALEEEWQPTPVFLPGESQGRQGLVGCHLWGRTESDIPMGKGWEGNTGSLELTGTDYYALNR